MGKKAGKKEKWKKSVGKKYKMRGKKGKKKSYNLTIFLKKVGRKSGKITDQKKKQFIRIAFFVEYIINTFYSPFVGGSIVESY